MKLIPNKYTNVQIISRILHNHIHLHMDRVKRIWYLSHIWAAKVQASLRIRAVSPEPLLLAHISSESRGTFRQKARSLAPLNGWACAVKICHDRMLKDTNLLDRAHILISYTHWTDSQQKKAFMRHLYIQILLLQSCPACLRRKMIIKKNPCPNSLSYVISKRCLLLAHAQSKQRYPHLKKSHFCYNIKDSK